MFERLTKNSAWRFGLLGIPVMPFFILTVVAAVAFAVLSNVSDVREAKAIRAPSNPPPSPASNSEGETRRPPDSEPQQPQVARVGFDKQKFIHALERASRLQPRNTPSVLSVSTLGTLSPALSDLLMTGVSYTVNVANPMFDKIGENRWEVETSIKYEDSKHAPIAVGIESGCQRLVREITVDLEVLSPEDDYQVLDPKVVKQADIVYWKAPDLPLEDVIVDFLQDYAKWFGTRITLSKRIWAPKECHGALLRLAGRYGIKCTIAPQSEIASFDYENAWTDHKLTQSDVPPFARGNQIDDCEFLLTGSPRFAVTRSKSATEPCYEGIVWVEAKYLSSSPITSFVNEVRKEINRAQEERPDTLRQQVQGLLKWIIEAKRLGDVIPRVKKELIEGLGSKSFVCEGRDNGVDTRHAEIEQVLLRVLNAGRLDDVRSYLREELVSGIGARSFACDSPFAYSTDFDIAYGNAISEHSRSSSQIELRLSWSSNENWQITGLRQH